jgi:peptidyl-prolyl cis-trans isomerase SurA
LLTSAAPRGRRDQHTEAERFTNALTRAHRAIERIKKGEPFEKVASQTTDDSKTRSTGGQLGVFGPGRLGATVDPVLETIGLGRVSEPIRIADGYVVVRLDARSLRPSDDKKTIRHIFLATDYAAVKQRKLAPVIDDKAEAKANSIIAKLKEGADFAVLARKSSEDSASRLRGGEVQSFRSGSLGPEVDAALLTMNAKDLRLVKGARGYRILFLESQRKTTLDAQRASLEEEIKRRRITLEDVQGYLDGLRGRSQIEKQF